MKKAQAGWVLLAIIIIVIVGVVAYFYFFQPIGPPVTDLEPEYENDLITIENYKVTTLNPYAGSATSMEFFVQSHSDKDLESVEVIFFDIPGFDVSKLRCDLCECEEIGKPEKKDECECKITDEPSLAANCTFDIKSLHLKRVKLSLKARDVGDIEQQFLVGYNIKYHPTGSRTALLPIVDEKTEIEPSLRYSVSDPTYGPVHASFEPPFGKTVIKDEQEIVQYWGVEDEPFEFKMNFQHVGGISGVKEPIDLEYIALKLNGLKKAELPCDLNDYVCTGSPFECDIYLNPDVCTEAGCVWDAGCKPCGVYDKQDECEGHKPPCSWTKCKDEADLCFNKGLSVPGTLVCNLVALEFDQPQISAIAKIEFDYTYEFSGVQTFTIRPTGD